MEYIAKKGCNRNKFKLEDKLNNSKITKSKKTKKGELCRDIQSNDIKRVASLRSTNATVFNQFEIKGILFK